MQTLKNILNSYPLKCFENCYSTNFLCAACFYSRLGTSGESKKSLLAWGKHLTVVIVMCKCQFLMYFLATLADR